MIGAQSEHTAAMARSLGAARVVEIPSVPTLADGLAGQIDDEALDIGRHGLDDIAVLTEEEIASVLDISPRTVRRDWEFARVWLARELAPSSGRRA